jgi:hypothetical protein
VLLATLLVIALTAAVFAVTQIGALITVLFVVAVLVLAYKRLPLLAFSVVFTALFAAYPGLAIRPGCGRACCC